MPNQLPPITNELELRLSIMHCEYTVDVPYNLSSHSTFSCQLRYPGVTVFRGWRTPEDAGEGKGFHSSGAKGGLLHIQYILLCYWRLGVKVHLEMDVFYFGCNGFECPFV